MVKPKVTAVILVNWNGYQITLKCINSLGKMDHQGFTIIVVDNASTDDSVSELSKCKHIKLLQARQNRGFSAGCNIGIEYAKSQGYDFIWLLNNDCTVKEDSLSQLLATLEWNHKPGIVGSKIVYPSGNIQCLGGPSVTRTLQSRFGWIRSTAIKNIDFISGASMLFSIGVYSELGPLDENFFLYSEDVDYCVRARNSGLTLYVAQKSVVIHERNGSTKKIGSLKYYEQGRSKTYLCSKHFSRWILLRDFALKLFSMILSLNLRGVIWATKGFYSGYKEWYQKP